MPGMASNAPFIVLHDGLTGSTGRSGKEKPLPALFQRLTPVILIDEKTAISFNTLIFT